MRSESLRYDLARLLVVVSFVWPFFNFSYFFPDATVEINFLLVFVAIGLVPVLLFEDFWSSLLAVVAIAVAAVWGPPASALRLLIGVAPFLFIMSLYRYSFGRGKELIPQGVAYKALVLFVGFSLLQHISFNVFPVIPDWLTKCLEILVPRYMDVPYDDSGLRGVQGWASEPSSAAMTCFSFSVVAMRQEPEKRWRVLLLFTVLAVVNKSVYCMLFLVLLALACAWQMRNRLRAVGAVLAFAVILSYFAIRAERVTVLHDNLVDYGLDVRANHELMRFAQVLGPLASFPRLYSPVTFFEHEIQPLGLLPLLVGYGSVFGLLLYCRTIFASFRWSREGSGPLGLAAVFVLSFASSPDFVPVIVAFAYAMGPIETAVAASVDIPAKSSLGRTQLIESGATVRREIAQAPQLVQPEN